LPYRYSSVRHSHVTEEIKKTISTKQAEVKGAITTADRQLVLLENKLEELNLSSDDDEAAGSREGKTEALRQLEEELKAVKASQKLLKELLSKSQEEAVAKAAGNQSPPTTVTFGDENSGFQAGTINGGVSGINFGGKWAYDICILTAD
jgi:TolA-binding protein